MPVTKNNSLIGAIGGGAAISASAADLLAFTTDTVDKSATYRATSTDTTGDPQIISGQRYVWDDLTGGFRMIVTGSAQLLNVPEILTTT